MLSSVLNSERAIEVNIEIMRAFVRNINPIALRSCAIHRADSYLQPVSSDSIPSKIIVMRGERVMIDREICSLNRIKEIHEING